MEQRKWNFLKAIAICVVVLPLIECSSSGGGGGGGGEAAAVRRAP